MLEVKAVTMHVLGRTGVERSGLGLEGGFVSSACTRSVFKQRVFLYMELQASLARGALQHRSCPAYLEPEWALLEDISLASSGSSMKIIEFVGL